MPMYFARRPDSSFSIVHAADEQSACFQLGRSGLLGIPNSSEVNT
jgi:hypothetical protein